MKFNNLKIKNGIFSHLTLLKNSQDISDNVIKTDWNANMLANCNFLTLFAGNPEGFDVTRISKILLKRREVGKTNWITLVSIPVFKPEDLIFEHKDYYNQAGKSYVYALVELDLLGNEGVYNEKIIDSEFDNVFITDGYKTFSLNNYTNYEGYTRNQQVGVYETLGRKYPLVVMNNKLNYSSMTTSAFLIKDIKKNDFNYYEQQEYINSFLNFLCDKKAKILKDYNGNIWLISLNGAPQISPIQELGNSIAEVSFNWVEIGDVGEEKDLKVARLIPVKPTYSQNK